MALQPAVVYRAAGCCGAERLLLHLGDADPERAAAAGGRLLAESRQVLQHLRHQQDRPEPSLLSLHPAGTSDRRGRHARLAVRQFAPRVPRHSLRRRRQADAGPHQRGHEALLQPRAALGHALLCRPLFHRGDLRLRTVARRRVPRQHLCLQVGPELDQPARVDRHPHRSEQPRRNGLQLLPGVLSSPGTTVLSTHRYAGSHRAAEPESHSITLDESCLHVDRTRGQLHTCCSQLHLHPDHQGKALAAGTRRGHELQPRHL